MSEFLCFIFSCAPFFVGSPIMRESFPILMSIALLFHTGCFSFSVYAFPSESQKKNPLADLLLTPNGSTVKIPKSLSPDENNKIELALPFVSLIKFVGLDPSIKKQGLISVISLFVKSSTKDRSF